MVEALISGTPVICSDKGACPEIISPDAGFVCSSEKDYLAALAAIENIAERLSRQGDERLSLPEDGGGLRYGVSKEIGGNGHLKKASWATQTFSLRRRSLVQPSQTNSLRYKQQDEGNHSRLVDRLRTLRHGAAVAIFIHPPRT